MRSAPPAPPPPPPALARRADGAFYTPPAIVEAMARWLLAHPLARVVDPGCGSGRLAAAIARQRPDLPIIAIDTDPLATLLTRATLAVTSAQRVQVLQQNYLTGDLCDRYPSTME